MRRNIPLLTRRHFLMLIFRLTVIGVTFCHAEADQHFLWRINTETSAMHLLGSIHMLSDDSYPLDLIIVKAFNDSEVVVFETDLDAIESLSVQELVATKALNPEGSRLRDVISEKLYKQVIKRLASFGIPVELMGAYKPAFVGLTLITLEAMRIGLKADLGIDAFFFDKAKSAGKEIRMLESPEFQMGVATLRRRVNAYVVDDYGT